MTAILDASAVIALLEGESGAEIVSVALPGAKIGAVNLAEIVGIYSQRGVSDRHVAAMLAPLKLDIVAADADLARRAGQLRAPTAGAGLSLGDRFCLALTEREKATALTADRQWLAVADTIGIKIELIR
jgi:ribonuclease VapC